VNSISFRAKNPGATIGLDRQSVSVVPSVLLAAGTCHQSACVLQWQWNAAESARWLTWLGL